MWFLFLSAYPHIKPPHYPVEAFYRNAQPNLIQKVPFFVYTTCHDKIHARTTMVSCLHTPLKQRLLGVVLVFRTGAT